MRELGMIPGTGAAGRVTKTDVLSYLKQRGPSTTSEKMGAPTIQKPKEESHILDIKTNTKTAIQKYGDNVEVIEMDRMRKLIADYMVKSLQVSAHVTSFVEVDMTNIVTWRNKMKNNFKQKYGENLTFMPIFVEAIVKAIKDFPIINSSKQRAT